MEAQKPVEDSEAVARRIRELQEQWRQAADVPRAQGEALWRRFKAVHDELWARCEAHFAAQAGVRAENLAKKVVLCERAEALSDSTNWLATADAIKGLQAEWKNIGAVTRGQEKAVWERFRAACDRFFTRRQEDLLSARRSRTRTSRRRKRMPQSGVPTSTNGPAAAKSTAAGRVKAISPVKEAVRSHPQRSAPVATRFRAAPNPTSPRRVSQPAGICAGLSVGPFAVRLDP
jgi:hypothetical protein